ncbi:nucleoside diphosphate-linked moiety X motif 19 isoform X1 [Zerene cesonia]|uniref:nucleoside diphosphate-linked moiety X motif 19 isoform X1 n=1 Tax=Zerene cesonia TaxID=33412 RepID=UPI0018E56B16|nr:nucleoside diphosphate-linked moiety X motif 19 isoform X1 [Zerene cesonia]
MKRAIEKCWRESASLIVLAKRNLDALPRNSAYGCNYDILLQTRTHNASFSNSVVFPGGVSEEADADDHWLRLFTSFGYTQRDFEALHRPDAPTNLIFQNNPVRRHVALRICAIRETFEELGLLICSSDHKKNKTAAWSTVRTDIDTGYWQSKISENPSELLNLCEAYNCYPDIWSLHYWSNWLSPATVPKRFDTAFFVTAIEDKITDIKSNSEVVKVEWARPIDILDRNSKGEVQLPPPQGYELNRISHFSDVDKLINFARNITNQGNELIFPIPIRTKDGWVYLLPGDHQYPTNVDYNGKIIKKDKTTIELRDTTKTLHRFEAVGSKRYIVTHNFQPRNHINMGNQIKAVNITVSNKE